VTALTVIHNSSRPTAQPHGLTLQNQPQKVTLQNQPQKVKIMILKWEIIKGSNPEHPRFKSIETTAYQT
jgi:hypothetical protein